MGGKQSQGGDYQKYMKQYAGDYQKYMKQADQGGKQSQGGDYQQYVKQYAGDDQKYMKQGGQSGKQSQGGDYQQYMKQYAGDYQKYTKQGGQGGDYKSYAADVKNWSNNEEVRDAFRSKYAGSYINLNAMDSQQGPGDAFMNKYARSYLPRDVKNWSNREEVREEFVKKYAGAYTNLRATKSDKSSNAASSQLSDLRSGETPPAAASNDPVEAHAETDASTEAKDIHAAIELASVPQQRAPTVSQVSSILAVTVFVAGIAFMRNARRSRYQPVLEPFLGA